MLSGILNSIGEGLKALTPAAGSLLTGGLTGAANLASSAMQQANFAKQQEYNAWAQKQGQAFSVIEAQHARDFNAEQAALGRGFSAQQADQAWSRALEEANRGREFAADQAQIARSWQERMSNTAYQRAMADMRTAGLNPILAYTQGGASSSPGPSASSGLAHAQPAAASTAQGPAAAASVLAAPGAPNLRSIMEGVTSSASEWARTLPTVANIEQQTKTGGAEEARGRAQARYYDAQSEFVEQATKTEEQRTGQMEALKKQTQGGAAASYERGLRDEEFYKSWWGTGARWIGKTLEEVVGPFTSSARDVDNIVANRGRRRPSIRFKSMSRPQVLDEGAD